MNRGEDILAEAHALGFDAAGLAPLQPPRAAPHFERWLSAGYHADMDWLERNSARILDPRRVLPEGRLVLSIGLGHHRAPRELEHGGRVARYAAGRDYHNVIGKRLKKLSRALRSAGLVGRDRAIVDAGPMLERSHAAEARLGFESKAANLLHRQHGPWMFLGELLLETEVADTAPNTAPLGSCGTCTACIDACPTTAIIEPGVVDARRCISYQTIENKGSVPEELRAESGPWMFGCDVCSEVCPWGSRAPDRSEVYGEHPALDGATAAELATLLPESEFRERFRGSPLSRAGAVGLARNAALVLGNVPTERGREALLTALESKSATLREQAAWSLARAHGRDRGVDAALERAARREPVPEAAASIGRHATQARIDPHR